MPLHDNRHPWFGPKRIGYGVRPATWQGWVVTFAVCLLIVAVALLLGGR